MNYKLLGDSVQIKELNETIKQVAPTNISVLITGESGTGKEVVANLIHSLSKRKTKPLIIVNCGAIPEGIIESELFGHQKGAFTGAIESREGFFEMADGGTIFLDEIGDMPLKTQVKILRVLENGEFMKVGGNKNIKVDVRIIAATNKDLLAEVQNKNFREDLYFRLKSINLHIPPLRERKQDIKLLFYYFVQQFTRDNNITFNGIDDDAMDFLMNYVWTGNARELKNFVESILVLNGGRKLTLDDVKKHLHVETYNTSLPVLVNKSGDNYDKEFFIRALIELKSDIMDVKNLLNKQEIAKIQSTFNEDDFIIPKEQVMHMNIDEFEKEYLKYLLRNNNWDVKKVASILNQSLRSVYRKVKKYEIRFED
jgi:DNA-binding NtrC family response regulator